MASDLKKAKDDLAKTLTDKQSVVAEAAKYPGGNNGQVCYDASGVDYDVRKDCPRHFGRLLSARNLSLRRSQFRLSTGQLCSRT